MAKEVDESDPSAGPSHVADIRSSSMAACRRRFYRLPSSDASACTDSVLDVHNAAATTQQHGGDTSSLANFRHRAGWLVTLLLFQSTSSFILHSFKVLIQTHPVIVYFLTMLVGAGGNVGSQSTLLVVRRLAVVAVRSKQPGFANESAWRTVCKEVDVGIRLATILFFAAFVRCYAFDVRGLECLAICLSMFAIVPSGRWRRYGGDFLYCVGSDVSNDFA